MTDSIPMASIDDCLGRTCLQWGADGDLTALDLNLVLERLALVDPAVTALQLASVEQQPCPCPVSI